MTSFRHLKALRKGLAFAALFMCFSVRSEAQSVNREASQFIDLSKEAGLHAEQAISILSKRLELNPANDEFRSAYVERPGSGLQVERFNQYYRGLKVEHGSFSITSKNAVPAYALGRFYPTAAAGGITPALDEATAFEKARAAVPAERYMWESDPAEFPKARLCFLEDFTNGDGDGNLHLAYAFDIYAEQPLARYNVYIDANDGHVLFMDAILKHIAATGKSLYSDTVSFGAAQMGSSLYYLHDSSRSGGIFTYNMNNNTSTGSALQVSSTTTFFAKDAAIDAHWGATTVYDYWKSAHNRNSWDGNGTRLRSYVHYGNNYNNASWNGQYMIYGDGSGLPAGLPPLTALDVCAHEVGHGVCASTAALVYNREPGAMNEGLSDIWGAVIEAYGDPHEIDSIAKDPWEIGEELTNTLRSMRDPNKYQQPNTYLGNYWIHASPTCSPSAFNDNCGVHYNSGVLNYWFYLICTGGAGTNDHGNKYKVSAIGMADAARVVYAAELALNSTANYNSMRTATIAAANTIFGSCTPQVEAIVRAWYAVGLGNDYAPCTAEISFGAAVVPAEENASQNGCRPDHMISVPVNLVGATLSGDSAEVTVVIAGGTAVAGTDFALLTPRFSFQPGGATSRNIDLKIFDNGTPNADKYIDITYSLTAGASNANQSVYKDTVRVYLYNDDYIPYIGQSNKRVVLSNPTSNTTITPFYGSAAGARAQYLYQASELRAAGVRVGQPISSLSFNVVSKVSTQPYFNFTLKLATISQRNFTQGVYTGTPLTYYSDSLTTTIGWTEIPFNAPLVWNGVDNLLVEICYANSGPYTGNDRVQAQAGPFFYTALNSNSFNPGCSLALSVNNLQGGRPLIQLNQKTVVETALNASRLWEVTPVKDAYYYNTGNHNLIAAIRASTDSIGCTNVQISGAGNGFKSATGGSQRSHKQFTIVPGVHPGGLLFDAILYYSSQELAGKDPAQLRIVQTTAADDDHLMPNDTKIVTPSDIIYGDDYIGFRGTFDAFGRFYLTDGNPTVSVGEEAVRQDGLWTGMNPFRTAPVLHWRLNTAELVTIRLYDVSGKLVYAAEKQLASGQNQMVINTSATLVPGHYVLQVVRPGSVFTSRLIKE